MRRFRAAFFFAIGGEPLRELCRGECGVAVPPGESRFEIEADQGLFRDLRQEHPAAVDIVVEIAVHGKTFRHQRTAIGRQFLQHFARTEDKQRDFA